MRHSTPAALCGLLASAISCAAPDAGPALSGHASTTDPIEFDSLNPPAMRELSFQSDGSKLNGLMYLAAGAGPHPTVIFLHGYAGNERNLDLAQAVRRAGANAMFFNYRGSWGSGGEFSLGHAIQDVVAAVEFVRGEDAVTRFRGDPERVTLVGHSFGGWLAAIATATDASIVCLGFLAGANFGPWGRLAGEDDEFRAALSAGLGADMDYEGGPIKAEPGTVIQGMIDRADEFDVIARAPALSSRALFMAIGERDEALPKAEHHDPVLAAFRAAGAERLREVVFDDDHYFSAHRVELSRRLVDWVQSECWR